MNEIEDLLAYLNNAYSIEKEWPKTFEVSAELYGKVCQVVFDHYLDKHFYTIIPGYGYELSIKIGQHGGIMFKNVELLIKKD